jgi:antitoxin component YwqK of YwqJK toxin-antitoxin module
MKKLLFLFFALLVFNISGFNQEKLRKMEMNGKSYFIYPYKFSSDRSSFYSYESNPGANEYEMDIVPYPNKLPDGDYVMYYEPVSVYKKKMWFFHKRGEYLIDSTRIGVIFKLKDNEKTGEAVFFDQYFHAVEKGNYFNNQKEGIWLRISSRDISSHSLDMGTRYKNFKYNYGSVIESIEYKNGIKEGKYKGFVSSGNKYFLLDDSDTSQMITVSKGTYRLNKAIGNWKFYYSNGQMASQYTLTDSLGMPIINDSYNYSYGRKLYFYNGWHEIYFPNGQLLNRKLYNYGRIAQRDTGYYHDGKQAWAYVVNEIAEKDTVMMLEDYFIYDSLGNLVQHKLARNGASLFTKYYGQSKKLCAETYFDNYFETNSKDSLVKKSIYYDCYSDSDPTRVSEIIYYHPETEVTLKRNLDYVSLGYYDEMDDFEFNADTVSNIYYVTEIDFKGDNKEIEFRTYKHFYRGLYYFFNEKYSSEIDSVILFVDGKRFTGNFKELSGKWGRKRSGTVKADTDKIKLFSYYYGGKSFSGNPSFGYSSKKFRAYGDYRRTRRRRRGRKLLTTYYGNYENGLKQGEWIDREKRKGSINEIANYNIGELHGKHLVYESERAGRWSDCKEILNKSITKKTGLLRKGRYYLSESENYENGEYHGLQTTYFCNGLVSTRQEYQNGFKEGIFELYNEEGQIKKKIYYKNGFYDGKYLEWSGNKKERYSLNFENGVLVGEYRYNHFNGSPSYTGNLVSGYKVGEWLTYFDDGTIKFKESFALEDSSYFSFKDSYGVSSGVRMAENKSHELFSCYSMQYYPSGQLASEGKIKRASREGRWKFYDEGGNLIRQITYEPGVILNTNENGKVDSVLHFGYYESWYINGQKQAEGYVLKESTKFDCYQEVTITMQDLLYINYWDKENVQTIKDKSGRLKSYHLTTGKMESEGELINGKKTGYWRYWDPEGKLASVGNYLNDLHEGKWLYGDLEGMHYLDDACFDISDPKVIKDMEVKKKILSINEVVYLKGKVIKEKKYTVDLNK